MLQACIGIFTLTPLRDSACLMGELPPLSYSIADPAGLELPELSAL